jgi:hypothetical protein
MVIGGGAWDHDRSIARGLVVEHDFAFPTQNRCRNKHAVPSLVGARSDPEVLHASPIRSRQGDRGSVHQYEMQGPHPGRDRVWR